MNPGLVHSPSNNVAVNRRESKDDRSVSPAYVQRIISPLKRHDRFQQVPRVNNILHQAMMYQNLSFYWKQLENKQEMKASRFMKWNNCIN
jgi:hypothetical protein